MAQAIEIRPYGIQCNLSCIVNTRVAYNMVTQGARALVAMALT